MTMARQIESARKQQSVIRGDKEIAMESSINVVNRQKGLARGAKGTKSETKWLFLRLRNSSSVVYFYGYQKFSRAIIS